MNTQLEASRGCTAALASIRLALGRVDATLTAYRVEDDVHRLDADRALEGLRSLAVDLLVARESLERASFALLLHARAKHGAGSDVGRPPIGRIQT
ncbi:hypothetical protein [Paraburkholderia saeva]|uniref:hypothetical protein n=1 Tax=Paraburkholderia saeva TaxID=2777537 RepID=UPI001D8532DC|nr:hypothetical protein [Paraburkholderia saeva]CAG4926180.1 hypothetical protein R70241_05446 [Paraburkholderia saeva]